METTDLKYGYAKQVPLAFDAALEHVRESLKSEGFGVLCAIDVREKFREKLGVEFDNYRILGACNPWLAHRALEADRNLGLLLPCNVVVYETGGRTFVAAIDAVRMLSIVGNSALNETARNVNLALGRVVDSVAQGA